MKIDVELLAKYVDDSPFDRGEWEESIEIMQAWLIRRERSQDFAVMLGYIACCSDSAQRQPGLHRLSELVKDMLDEHGYDG